MVSKKNVTVHVSYYLSHLIMKSEGCVYVNWVWSHYLGTGRQAIWIDFQGVSISTVFTDLWFIGETINH